MTTGHRAAGGRTGARFRPRWRATVQPRAALETGLIVAAFAALFFLLPRDLRGDDITRLRDITVLLGRGQLTSSRFSLVEGLISAPVLLLGHLTQSRAWWAAHFNTIALAAGVAAAWGLLHRRMDARLFRLSVLVLLCASFMTSRLRDYNGETVTAVLVTLGILCLATRRHVLAGWGAIVLGVVNNPAALAGLILLAGLHTVRTRQLRHLLPVAAAAALIAAEAWIRRGGPLVTGYQGQPYDTPFLLGLGSILFSSGRGLLFFTPGLVLWFSPRVRRGLPGRTAVALMLAFLAGLILIYSAWWAWYGGLSWGPRFFEFAALPAAILIAAGIGQAGRSAAADLLTLAALTLSAWVAFAGATVDLTTALQYCRAHWASQACLYRPQDSGLWQPAAHFPHLTGATLALSILIGVVYLYLGAPLAASLGRAARPRRSWTASWRI